jgi:drug/metabolite transporter (DMT)-like permease
MELENILYGGVQIAHNFGAAAVAGLPVAALWFKPAAPVLRKMAWLTLLAWLVQAASGVGFGTVSYFEEGELPQIHHLALGALCLKIACAALAVTLLAVFFLRRTSPAPSQAAWRFLTILGVTALTCAAVLRWFS